MAKAKTREEARMWLDGWADGQKAGRHKGAREALAEWRRAQREGLGSASEDFLSALVQRAYKAWLRMQK